MGKFFSTCLLVQKGSAATELLEAEVSPDKEGSITFPDGPSVLLSGGFSKLTPKSSAPLSPTLHLNYAMATLSSEELQAIGEAELTRINEVNYRSYTVDVDPRICVLSDSVKELSAFMDTYGGLLDIEPLLLKGYHPDFQTATELNLDSKGQLCRLEYQIRSPINQDLCTYCGACGPVCPEMCLSETLFLDFDKCNFCKECESACAVHAIDVTGALVRVLEVPAVMVLGRMQVDLPDIGGNVYKEEQLTDYLETLFPYQVDAVVTCDMSICQFSGRMGSGCDLCLSSCRFGAIVQDDRGVIIDSLKCEECGACIAVCPTGSLQNQRFNDKSFANYFQKVTIPENATIVIGSEADLQKLWWFQQTRRREGVFFLQYENVQSLSLFHSMFLINRGARRLLFLHGDGNSGLNPQFKKQIVLGNEIAAHLFNIEDALAVCDLSEFDSMMAVSLPSGFGKGDPEKTFNNRRMALAKALESMVIRSGNEATISPRGYLPFATLSCDRDRCTQCMACLNECKIEALKADQQQLTLAHVGAMCVGCGLCARVCPEDALKLSPEFCLAEPFFTSVELARAEPMACKKCGKVFGTRKSFDRVMAILAKKEPVDISHFEYCETCRVVNLFEAE